LISVTGSSWGLCVWQWDPQLLGCVCR